MAFLGRIVMAVRARFDGAPAKATPTGCPSVDGAPRKSRQLGVRAECLAAVKAAAPVGATRTSVRLHVARALENPFVSRASVNTALLRLRREGLLHSRQIGDGIVVLLPGPAPEYPSEERIEAKA